jgi:hypothetical protein
MRPLPVLAVLAALATSALLLTGPAFAAGAVRSSKAAVRVPCRPAKGTTTIAHSAKARIFTDEKTGNYYACLYKNGHPRVLSTIEHWEYEMVRFSGKYVAFVAFAESSNAYVGVLNMSTGHHHNFHEGEEVAPIKPPPGQCPSADPNCEVVCPQVDALVLKSDGAVAWIAVNFPAPSPSTGVSCGNEIPPVTEVRRYDSRGLRVIGQGAGIEPTSLRLHGSTLTWVDEGMSATASLL